MRISSLPQGPAQTPYRCSRRWLLVALSLAWLAVLVVGLPGLAASAAGPSGAKPIATSIGWQWPLRPVPNDVVRRFDPPDDRWGGGHRGVDLGGTFGAKVHAAGTGIITFVGVVAGRGVVTVTHGVLRTTYEPVTPAVAVGDLVQSGDVIATLDLIGGHCLPRACLHWGLLRGNTYLDPLSLVGAGPVRLLPLGGVAVSPVRPGPLPAPLHETRATSAVEPRERAVGSRASPQTHRAGLAIAVGGGLAAGGVALAVVRHRGRRQ